MKTLATLALAALTFGSVSAQEKEAKLKVLSDIKFSGYIMSQYQYSDKESNKGEKDINSFNIRMVRMALEGRVAKDFYWKAQLQVNGNTSNLTVAPRMVDAFAEWQKYDAFKVKAGQFKRPFTFENPMHPITQGFMSYSQNVTKLAGFSDRNGEHSSNGRDIGVQLQGDLLKAADGHHYLHYQVGVFNGQGTNMKDVDQRKDVIGGVWVAPVKGLRIGAFGWTGSYARKGTWTELDANGVEQTRTVCARSRRTAMPSAPSMQLTTGPCVRSTYTVRATASRRLTLRARRPTALSTTLLATRLTVSTRS